MQAGALLPYDLALSRGRPLSLRHRDGRTTVLDVPRWLATADAADATVLDRCAGPVLDVGCGPGRILAALAERNLPAVGIDIAESALQITRQRGLCAIRADALTTTYQAGRWHTAILLDGNIGIGGDPVRLLRHIGTLLDTGGRLIVESHSHRLTDRRGTYHFVRGAMTVGPAFAWAEVGAKALARYALEAGLVLTESWRHQQRAFHQLRIADTCGPGRDAAPRHLSSFG